MLVLKRTLKIPKINIYEVNWVEDYVFKGRILRAAGAGIYGVLYAGRYVGMGRSFFLYVRQPRGVSWLNGHFKAKKYSNSYS